MPNNVTSIQRAHDFEHVHKTVSDVIQVIGFLHIGDIASPPYISRHLCLPVSTSSTGKPVHHIAGCLATESVKLYLNGFQVCAAATVSIFMSKLKTYYFGVAYYKLVVIYILLFYFYTC